MDRWRGPTEKQLSAWARGGANAARRLEGRPHLSLEEWQERIEAIPDDVWKASMVRARHLERIARQQRRLAVLALVLAGTGCILVVPAPFAILTGWLAIRPRGLRRSAGHTAAMVAIVIGSIVTVLALAGLVARVFSPHV